MARIRRWERGAADLVALGAAMAILAITVAGTAGSFIYGRAALAREEHFKAAAYILREKMEEVQTAMQLVKKASDLQDPQNLLRPASYAPIPIESTIGPQRQIFVTVRRDSCIAIDLAETGRGTDYYLLKMTATWREPDMAPNLQNQPGKQEQLTFMTAFVAKRDI